MSIVENILKMNKQYLYQKIISFINKNPDKIELLKYKNDSYQVIFNKMEDLLDNNNLESNICHYNKKTLEGKKQYLDGIISYYDGVHDEFRLNHLTVLKNLLFPQKDLKYIYNEDVFNENDFILTYSLLAIEKIFQKVFKEKDSKDLKDDYLYLIFQIKNPDFIIKIKYLIYTILYEKKNAPNINKFILKSSKILKEENIDNSILINLTKKYQEINLDINIVPSNMKTFFNLNNENNEKILQLYNKEKIINNFKLIKSKEIKFDDIVFNKFKFEKGKIVLFTPDFLLANGLKSKFEYCDVEIFNDDNYSIDTFSKFITKIIDEINKSINKNDFSNDYMKNNLIKLHQLHDKKYFRYISAKLDYNDKIELNKKEKQNIKIKDIITINICNDGTYKQKEKDIESNNLNESIELLSKSKLSLSNLSYLGFQKQVSDYLEDIINRKLTKNIEKEKLNALPNILFMLNLKIPDFNEKNNSIDFKSVHLDFFNEKKKFDNNNYYYGCKEIDAVFKNNSEILTDVSVPQYFQTNLTYIKNKKENDFTLIKEKNFQIYPNSIFFCEIKKSFPNYEAGKEKVINVKVEECKEIINKNLEEDKDDLKTYKTQLIKLIKKFRFFLNTFKDEIKEKNELNIQLVFLYDSFNIENELNFENIKRLTTNILKNYGWRLNNRNGKVVFQLVFFDYLQFQKETEEIIEEKDKIIEEQKMKIEEEKIKMEKEKIKADEIIKEKDEIIKEKDKIIENLMNLIKKANLSEEDKNNVKSLLSKNNFQ